MGMPVLSGIPTDAPWRPGSEAAMEAMAGIDHEDIDPEVGDDVKIELTNLDPGDYTIPNRPEAGRRY